MRREEYRKTVSDIYGGSPICMLSALRGVPHGTTCAYCCRVQCLIVPQSDGKMHNTPAGDACSGRKK